MKLEDMMKTHVVGDGKTVWVNADDGSCIGRFSRFGIDVHRAGSEQIAGLGECLDCTHGRPSIEGWRRFQDGMRRFHGVTVSDDLMPAFVVAQTA